MSERSPISIEGLEIPDFTFKPNVWTETFLSGLNTINVKNLKVVELGVGSGIVGIDLIRRGVSRYVGVDIDERILPVACRNIDAVVPNNSCDISLMTSDLLSGLGEEKDFDLICGCLPQVSKPPTISLGTADTYARYFDCDQYCSDLNIYGLGLNEGALIQSKERLKPFGSVVLVLSGRAGKEVLEKMFERNGFSPKIIFEKNIAQLKETTLATLVEYESHGCNFYFYSDQECNKRISVAEAEDRRLRGLDSYHKLYVVEGKLNSLRQNL
ncbi:MAG: 50S ribosomal protein L11 methyltransferase [Candidatus Shapirobacteria bacterium]|nr:50S ribosomal protein L11 methyltransferase [Candidatus Shapirobacteria bacterium]